MTQAQDPPLPAGLGAPPATQVEEPALPSGLSAEPSLPTGLGVSASTDEAQTAEVTMTWSERLPFELSGYIESRIGARVQDDPTQKEESVGELRLQLQLENDMDWAQLSVNADFLFDPVLDRHRIDLESGKGWLDLREASLVLRPADSADLKIGRQVLTWGTGDLLFINDLFPKDWNSFFIGRHDEYLKAPSDAIKLALFNDAVNLDIVYSPRFDSDRFIDGRRLSYFSPAEGAIVGRDFPVTTIPRDQWFIDDEISFRAYRNLGSWEGALYGYRGYWKSPGGQDPATGRATFPRLTVAGASLRGPVATGIAAVEVGFYDSRDDDSGNNPFINNSEFRFLAGYEQELMAELTLGVQYYLEWMQDYDRYEQTLPVSIPRRDEQRHVFTTRLTRLLMNQNLTLSLFNYYSPSDEDGYLRPNLNYKLSDLWQIEVGGNLFYGEQNHSFFGQFEDNNNLYLGLRYGF